MYNRYIGNTGKVYRVPGPSNRRGNSVERHAHKPPPVVVEAEHKLAKKSGLFGGLIGGGGIFGGDGLKSPNLPLGLEISDLIILGLLLFLFLESGDEEFLIILGFLAYSIYKDHTNK